MLIAFYIIIGLIASLLIIALFLPPTYHIEKTTIINSNVQKVMNRVADLTNYAAWNPWQQSDPGATGTISGDPQAIGHKYAWQGKKVGMGSLTIRDIDNKHVHFNLEFIKPFKSRASDDWLFEEWGNGETKVTWSNNGEFPYPIARLIGPGITKTLNKQFEQGLSNLKNMCEKITT